MIEAKMSRKRRVNDLAEVHDVTPAAVYQAIKNGYVPAIRCGAALRIPEEAFVYHAENGWGPDVPPYGTHAAKNEAAA